MQSVTDLGKQAAQRLAAIATPRVQVPGSGGLTRAERMLGAVVGGFVADASCQPMQWVYDKEVILSVVGKMPEPAFAAEPLGQFFRVELGEGGAYGDQALAALRAVHKAVVGQPSSASTLAAAAAPAERPPQLVDLGAYVGGLRALFGDGSKYGPWPEEIGATDRKNLPVQRKWRNHSVKTLLETGAALPDDHQMDGGAKAFAVAAPLSFLLLGPREDDDGSGGGDSGDDASAGAVVDAVDRVVRVTQDSHAAAAAARVISEVLVACLNGATPAAAVRAVAAAENDGDGREGGGDEAAAVAAAAERRKLRAAVRAGLAELDEQLAAATLSGGGAQGAGETLPPFALFAAEKGISCGVPHAAVVALCLFATFGGEEGRRAAGGREAAAAAAEAPAASVVAENGEGEGGDEGAARRATAAAAAAAAGRDPALLGAYARVVREAIKCGGDCASRAVATGSLAGAVGGVDSIPRAWLTQTRGLREVVQLTRDVLRQRLPDSARAVAAADELLVAIGGGDGGGAAL